MAIDLGNTPTGTPPTSGQKLQMRLALGIGVSDSPTFAGVTLGASGILVGGTNQIYQRNGTNAQSLLVANTYTDASNYERAFFGFSSNVLRIGTENLGTGTARTIDIVVGGTTRLSVTASAAFFTGNVNSTAALICGTSAYVGFGTRSNIQSPADGVVRLNNAAITGFTRLEIGATNQGIHQGTGSPEGVVTGLVGSIFLRTDGGTLTTLYVKESGSGNTGWMPK